MPLLKFNLRWEDDMNVLRDIEIINTQTFMDFHDSIKKSFAFPPKMEATMYVSDDFWRKGQAISSAVEKNIRGAAELSMVKTPIGAFLNDQHQKFIYVTNHKKKWELQIELISMRSDPMDTKDYPKCIREVGISPAQFGKNSVEKDVVVEIEEKYDLDAEPDADANIEGGDDFGGDEFDMESIDPTAFE
jgi:hypothetical protein